MVVLRNRVSWWPTALGLVLGLALILVMVGCGQDADPTPVPIQLEVATRTPEPIPTVVVSLTQEQIPLTLLSPVDGAEVASVALNERMSLEDKLKLLIIDKNPDAVDLVELTVGMAWSEATTLSASSGDAGIYAADAEEPNLVVLEVKLPDMDGFRCLSGDTPVFRCADYHADQPSWLRLPRY